MLRVAQGWYGSEWYGMAVGAVVETAQRLHREYREAGEPYGERVGQTVQAKKLVVVKLLLR